MKVFEMQLRAAEATGKPVQVHTRDAESLCIDVASHYRLGRVLLHWFQGEDRLPEVHDKEYFVSFGPALIYSKKLQRMATAVEREFVLTESDGPVPFAPLGGCQGPSLIPSVIFKLSELWRVGFDEAREIVTSNAIDFLTTTGKG